MTDITIKYVGDSEETITIKDFKTMWIDEHWEGGVSITGVKRDTLRGYYAVLELSFEYDTQLNTVAKNILDATNEGRVIQVITDEGFLPVVPESFESAGEYINQLQTKPSKLVLVGNIQDDMSFFVEGVLWGDADVYWGQTDVLWGG